METTIDSNLAVDADPSQRPGVPMEKKNPSPAGNAHWTTPERQRDPGNILKRKGLAELTPVFGTSVPPRGLSGLMRRAAYEIPEHFTSHWLVLMLADRVDSAEYTARRALPWALPLAIVGGLAFAGYRRSQRSWLARTFSRRSFL